MAGIAIYPGTFDPVTRGHIDVVERALKMFDRVVIGVADSPAKQPFFNLDERLDMLQTVFAGKENVLVKALLRTAHRFCPRLQRRYYRAWFAGYLGF